VKCLPSRWGAVCNRVRTGGHWSVQEKTNFLDFLAGSFAVKAFTKQWSSLLQMDNCSVIFYANNMLSTHLPILSLLAYHLWQWCLQRGITLSAKHLPGIMNTIADQESNQVEAPRGGIRHNSTDKGGTYNPCLRPMGK